MIYLFCRCTIHNIYFLNLHIVLRIFHLWTASFVIEPNHDELSEHYGRVVTALGGVRSVWVVYWLVIQNYREVIG